MEMYIHKENGLIIRRVSDFETITKDWNNDNDTYKLTVAYFTEGFNHNFALTEDELEDYEMIYNIMLYDKMRQKNIVISPVYIKAFKKNYPIDEILEGYLYRLEGNDGMIYYTDKIKKYDVDEWISEHRGSAK